MTEQPPAAKATARQWILNIQLAAVWQSHVSHLLYYYCSLLINFKLVRLLHSEGWTSNWSENSLVWFVVFFLNHRLFVRTACSVWIGSETRDSNRARGDLPGTDWSNRTQAAPPRAGPAAQVPPPPHTHTFIMYMLHCGRLLTELHLPGYCSRSRRGLSRWCW